MQPTKTLSERPWGHELLWAVAPGYAAKILVIDEGHRTSLQHHEHKEETLLVLEGRVAALVEGPDGAMVESILEPGDVLHVPPRQRHRLAGLTAARLVEVSTPELADVVRHEDDYGRS